MDDYVGLAIVVVGVGAAVWYFWSKIKGKFLKDD